MKGSWSPKREKKPKKVLHERLMKLKKSEEAEKSAL